MTPIPVEEVCRLLVDDPSGWVWSEDRLQMEHPGTRAFIAVGIKRVTVNGWVLGWLDSRRIKAALAARSGKMIADYLRNQAEAEADRLLAEHTDPLDSDTDRG